MPNGDSGHTTEVVAVVDDRGRDTCAPPTRTAGRLVCVTGVDVGRTIRLGDRPVVIGRGRDCDARLDAPEVSRRHLRVERRGDEFHLTDLGSRNGTLLNGLPVTEHALRPGDRIQLASATILLFGLHDELEHQALRMQRLESLAQLAGGVVHEFRNALGVIAANAELLEQDLAGPGIRRDWIDGLRDIRDAAQHGITLAQRLLLFCRRDPPGPSEGIDVAGLIDGVLALVRRTFEAKHRIQLATRVADGLQIRGIRDELQQVLLNLVLNARDAMPSGGALTVTAREQDLDRAAAMRLHLPDGGRFVEITVTDTGAGMDEETLARALEPFFTTKPPGEGTGLGLSTVYGIVRKHGGNVFLESTLGRGTRARVLLPRAGAPPGVTA